MLQMCLNKILVVGCLMLGFPAASMSAPFNPDELFKVQSSPQAAGTFQRTAANISDVTKAAENRQLVELASAKIAKDPNNDKYYAARAQCYEDLGQFADALKDANSAIRLNGSSKSYFELRGSIKGSQKNYVEAVRDFESAIQFGANSAQLYRKKCSALSLLGRNTDALQDAEKAVSLDPAAAEGYALRGTIKSYLKNLTGAEQDCKKAEALAPNNPAITAELRSALSNSRLHH